MNIYIPYKKDFNERERNLNFVVYFLLENTDYDIIIGSQTPVIKSIISNRVKYFTNNYDVDHFNKCKLFNDMFYNYPSNIICNYDCDVILDITKLEESKNLILNKCSSFVIPYSGLVYDIPEDMFNNLKLSSYKGFKDSVNINKCKTRRLNSIGGINIICADDYIECGLMNERFKNWGGEDDEVVYRFKTLNKKVTHLDGELYHLPHPRNDDNSIRNRFYKSTNMVEFKKVTSLKREELKKYISDTFKWVKR